ncbi:MAG TPA: methyl-accepting chemotaxis protein, partial [Thermoanaerobaculaceae bacterium]|nr:methyl-accepting chemotaxis protein [Thermoanaerobaculaceae bacterium]
MARASDTLPKSPIVGLLLMVAFGVIATTGLAIGMAHGTPSWVAYLVLPIGAALLVLYVVFAFLPHVGQVRTLGEMAAAATTLEQQLGQATSDLQAGDLVATLAHAQELPPRLATPLANAARALGALVQQIQNSSIEVAASGSTVNATASELASGSSQQAAGVVEITATMEELARTAAQIAANAASQAELAAQSEQSGDTGAAAVEEALHGVEEVQKRINGIADRADTLGARSKEIYRVLELITEIAQETHLLSLNATIEAAAAGEHGRRFSVVADEVRHLAQRSQESVASVRSLLDEFAGSIRATVVATEEGSKEAALVLERARSAAAAIAELRGALTHTARAAREISLATQQQRTASDQVVLTLKEVSQVIQRMAQGLKHFSVTSERLHQLALSIQLLTQSFRLDSPRSLKNLGERCAGEVGLRSGHWESLGPQMEEVVRQSPFVELAFVADMNGNIVASSANPEWVAEGTDTSAVTAGLNAKERPWFQAVVRDGRTVITPLYESLLTGQRCFTVASP